MGFNILDFLLPRETKFFDYMTSQVDCFVQASAVFKDIVYHIENLTADELKKKIMIIDEYEASGDDIERKIIDELNSTFITPLDREDIHTLAINIDRAMDILNSITRRIEIYQIHKIPINVCKFTDLIVKMAEMLSLLMNELRHKHNIEGIQANMHTVENEADDLFHVCMAELFSKNNDPLDVIRFKEVYEHLESVVDAVDYIGKLVRGIMVKQG